MAEISFYYNCELCHQRKLCGSFTDRSYIYKRYECMCCEECQYKEDMKEKYKSKQRSCRRCNQLFPSGGTLFKHLKSNPDHCVDIWCFNCRKRAINGIIPMRT